MDELEFWLVYSDSNGDGDGGALVSLVLALFVILMNTGIGAESSVIGDEICNALTDRASEEPS